MFNQVLPHPTAKSMFLKEIFWKNKGTTIRDALPFPQWLHCHYYCVLAFYSSLMWSNLASEAFPATSLNVRRNVNLLYIYVANTLVTKAFFYGRLILNLGMEW